jgi:hypothetical protein
LYYEHDGKLDHWKPENLRQSGYSILPVVIDGDFMEIPWQDSFEGERSVTERDFIKEDKT